MMHYIRICGPAGWGLLFVSLVVTIIILHTAISFVRQGTGQRIKIGYKLNALIFWGFMGSVLGFLGQTSAIHRAMTIIIPAQSISPEMIDRGFRESFMPSFWGFGILLISVITLFVSRLILKRGSYASGNRPSRKNPGLGTAAWALLLLAVFWSPPLAYAGQGSQIPPILTSEAWIGKVGPDDIVFRLWSTSAGSLSGEAHTIRDGKHMTQSPAIKVIWNDPDLELHMNTGVVFRGTLDATNNRIEGRLDFKNKTLAELPLVGVNPNNIRGLLARPVPPSGNPLYSYSVPAENGDGWQSARPEIPGLQRANLEALVTDIIEGKAGILHSLLIAYKGTLVLEEYFFGYEREDLHRLASVTKSVSSLITGIAIDRGEIRGVETPLIEFFPRHGDAVEDEWINVTLKHLLTMSIGTAWTEEEADRTHGAGEAFFGKLFSKSFAHRPGEKWQYVSANVNLLGGVIKSATGLHADEYAAAHLFGPLGIEKWSWDYGMVDGYRLMDGSLMLMPRDMAKLGALVSGEGTWNGKQVVAKEWIKESTASHIIPSENGSEKYGYLWWLFYIPSNTGIREAVIANGRGSQFIAVFPELDLVLVTTGSNDENGMQFAIGRLLTAHILNNIEVATQTKPPFPNQ